MKIKQLKIFVILLAILLTFRLSESDANDKAFVKKVKGAGFVTDAIQTRDGDYISVSRATWETCIVRKVNPLGKRIWEKRLSQVMNGWLILESIAETNEGYVLVGSAYESTPDDSLGAAIVVALHSDGTVNWTKQFGITTSFGASGSIGFDSVTSTPDGGFIVTGGAYEVPFLLLKFAQDGNIQWQKAFQNSFRSLSSSDNGLILAAKTSNGADVAKLDHLGNVLWSKTLTIEGFSLKTLGNDSDDGIVIAGTSKESNLLSLIRLDSNGQIHWKAKYSLEGPFSISGIVPTADGGYALTGATKRNGFVLKIDAQKRLVFQRKIGVRGTDEQALSIFASSEGGFVLFGSSGEKNLLFMRLNTDGLVPGCKYFHDLNSKAVRAGAVKVGSSIVSSQTVTLQGPGPLDVTSTSSGHSVSTICQ